MAGPGKDMIQLRIPKTLFASFCGAQAQPDNGTVLLTMSFHTGAAMNTALSAALRGQVYPVKKKKKKPGKK